MLKDYWKIKEYQLKGEETVTKFNLLDPICTGIYLPFVVVSLQFPAAWFKISYAV